MNRITNAVMRCVASIVDATRSAPDQPADGLKPAVRFFLRRMGRPIVRGIAALGGPGAATKFYTAALNRRAPDAPMLTADVIRRESVESLVAGADEYFRHAIENGGTAFLRRKPFHDVQDSPELLYRLGQMLHGARLAPGLHVVEYGAGTGWLSGALWQMGCRVTCVDASEAALELARESFDARRPIAARPNMPIATALTDGRLLPLADASADRIVCHDAFHHVPNQEQILREFHRVLRPGGLACFCEPGRYHSATRHSQAEMQNYRVLENDIVLEDIWRLARAAGFTGITVRPVLAISYAVTMPRYLALVRKGRGGFGGREALMNGTTSDSIFFLEKGPFRFDSRFANRLGGSLRASPQALEAAVGRPVRVAISCANTGRATWLADASDADGLGTVRVGVQLCDGDGRVIDRDWRRLALSRDVPPGDTAVVEAELLWHERGRFTLRFDLVSEGIAWFEADAAPARLPVAVA